ncbi:EF-hand domain-containing protein [Streptomyces kanasensis]|uniref:EF-hand domain-containing protein n=1 Tax=Streptomyces kanasensis TaxID=936756 RepID=UPI0036FE00BC
MGTRDERFQALFKEMDTDGNGVIERVDFDTVAHRACVSADAAPGSPRWRQTTALANRMWEALAAGAGAEGAVTLEEFTAAAEDPRFIDNVIIPYELALLGLFDKDGDGRVSMSEWMAWKTGFGLSQIDALTAFQEVDDDGDGYIAVDEYSRHVEETYAAS